MVTTSIKNPKDLQSKEKEKKLSEYSEED